MYNTHKFMYNTNNNNNKPDGKTRAQKREKKMGSKWLFKKLCVRVK